jgi:electron transfer flavoprotein beta subunit
MNIIVCVKRVPATDSRVRIAPDGKSIDPAGVKYVIGPYDEFAVEEALRIKEKEGKGEVIILCLGPADAATQIRSALAMGADRGIHLLDHATYRDPFSTGIALAEALKKLAFDLVLFGKQAVDDDALQVPAAVCRKLGIPLVQVVTKLERKEGRVTATRQIEGGSEIVETPLPAGITCQKGLNEPRYASLPNIMKAKKKPIETQEAPPPDNRTEIVKLEPPPARPPGKIVGEGAQTVPELVRLLHEEAKVI